MATRHATRSEDALIFGAGVWMLSGLFLDGWAHRNQKPETFFSPWHGILYSGFTASAVLLLWVIRRNQIVGTPWHRTLPVGYGVRSLGVGVFGVGAVLDLIWHRMFGIEVSIEALLSPSHLVLLSGGLLMALGPVVSTLHRERGRQSANSSTNSSASWSSTGAIIGSITFMVSLIEFFLMYASPYDRGVYTKQELASALSISEWLWRDLTIVGLTGILLFAVVSAVAVGFLVRTIKLPRGALFVVLVAPAFLQTVLVSFSSVSRLIGVVVAGVLAELTWPRVATRNVTVRAIWIAILTLIQWYGFFAGIALDGGIGWSVHLWTGVPVLAAIFTGLVVHVMNRHETMPTR